jgi:hypothetical protein
MSQTEAAPAAAAEPAGGEPAAAPAAAPVVLRASGRVVAGYARLAGGLGILAALGWWLELTGLPILLGSAAAAALLTCFRVAWSRLELHADRLRIRGPLRARTVPAPDLARFSVRITPFGRHLVLDRYGRWPTRLAVPVSPRFAPDPRFDGQVEQVRQWCAVRYGGAAGPHVDGRSQRRVLPVVVAGLLLMAAAVPDRPWGWVADDVSVAPTACSAAPSPGNGPPGESLDFDSDHSRISGCRWSLGDGRKVEIEVALYERSGLHSGETLAVRDLRESWPGPQAWSSGRLRPLPGAREIGDDAISAHVGWGRLLGPPVCAVVAARRGNVIVWGFLGPVDDLGAATAGEVTGDDARLLVGMVRAVVDAVE